jgi:hypothetical protein
LEPRGLPAWASLRPPGFAGLTPLGLVAETLRGVEGLLPRCKDKLRLTVNTIQYPIVIFHSLLPDLAGIRTGSGYVNCLFHCPKWRNLRNAGFGISRIHRPLGLAASDHPYSVLLAALLLTKPLPGESFFSSALFAGLQVVAVALDFLNDVLRLYLPLEAPERILKRLSLLNEYFSQKNSPPFEYPAKHTHQVCLP